MTDIKATLRLFRVTPSMLLRDLNWIWLLVAIAWIMVLTGGHQHSLETSLESTHAHSMHHGSAVPQSLIFLASWEVMVIAMMLPSTLPTANALIKISVTQRDRRQAPIAFLLAYLLIWTGFAGLITLLDTNADHWFQHYAEKSFALRLLPNLFQPLLGWIILGMGIFQFTPIKQLCLKGCRTGVVFIAQRYETGWYSAWKLGLEHGFYCLGCCWALMVGMIAVGMENLVYMLTFTAIMTLEKVWKYGEWLSNVVGISLIITGISYIGWHNWGDRLLGLL